MRLEFDRGTILCTQSSAAAAAVLPGMVWDSRVGAYRAAAYRYAEIRAALANAGGAYEDHVLAVTTQHRASREPVPLRPYQEGALAAWEMAGRRGSVVLPTGAGKTRLAIAAVLATGAASLILAPTRILVEQWLAALRTFYAGPLGQFGDGEHTLAPLTVATFESAYRHMHRLGNRFELLVVDEVHHFASGLRQEALEMSTAPLRLGLSATLPRDDGALGHLSRLVGPTVYEQRLTDLAGTYLAPLEIHTLKLALSAAERAAYETEAGRFRPLMRVFFRAQPLAGFADLVAAFSRTVEGQLALAAFYRARRILALTGAKQEMLRRLLAQHRDERVLVFTSDNTAAYAVAREHLIMPITCDIGRAERTAALARFRAGELLALVSARVLNEGMDVPDASVAIIVGGTLGEREHVQRIGRLLRPAPGKRAIVYDLVSRGTPEERQAVRKGRALGGSAAEVAA